MDISKLICVGKFVAVVFECNTTTKYSIVRYRGWVKGEHELRKRKERERVK